MPKLAEFLAKAKKAGYAGSGEAADALLEDGSKAFEYSEGNYRCIDRYFGSNPFIGQEIVYLNNVPVWAMNYYGGCRAGNSKAIYGFLKKSLLKIEAAIQFRGPKEFAEGEFVYKNKSEGNMESFRGKEIILQNGEEVYSLVYCGGRIKR